MPGDTGLPEEDGARVVCGAELSGQVFPASAGRVSGAVGGGVC